MDPVSRLELEILVSILVWKVIEREKDVIFIDQVTFQVDDSKLRRLGFFGCEPYHSPDGKAKKIHVLCAYTKTGVFAMQPTQISCTGLLAEHFIYIVV